MREVIYTAKHREIVEKGIEAISAVLSGNDLCEKESLLFCLDRYLDPYFGYNLPYEKEIIICLQQFIVNANPIELKEDALDLLDSHCWPPFSILEKNLNSIEDALLPSVIHLINIDPTE